MNSDLELEDEDRKIIENIITHFSTFNPKLKAISQESYLSLGNEFSVLSPVRYYDKQLKSFVYRSRYDYRLNAKSDSHYDSKLDKRSDGRISGLKSFSLSAGIMTIRYYRLNSLSLSNLYNSLRLSNPNMRLTKSQFLRNHHYSIYP